MSKSPKIQSGILFETFTPVSNDEILFLENKTVNGIPKAKFKVRLQTLEEKNGNGRYYDMSIGRSIVEGLKPKAIGRSLLMEIDHPMTPPTPNDPTQSFAKKRAVTVELKNSGALITDLDIHNKEIIGLAETLTGFQGPDFYNVIAVDKADIGFSLRMFGRTQLDESTGLNKVVGPIRPITYDIVTNPSHKTAKILEFLTEDINQFITNPNMEMTVLQESSFDCDCIRCASCNEDVYAYLDDVLNSSFKLLGPVYFKI